MRRTGLFMMVAGWLSLGGLIWWVLGGALAQRETPNAHLAAVTSPASEIVLKRGSDGHYRAPGFINGQRVEFLLDTGATGIAIPADVAQRIGAQPGRAYQAQTAAGVVVAHATRLSSVSLGGLTAHDVAGSIIANPGSDEVLLGMSFLSRFDINIKDDEMRLRTH